MRRKIGATRKLKETERQKKEKDIQITKETERQKKEMDELS
jgi:hypothetical protein